MAEVDINQSYRWLGGIFRQVFSLQGDISPAQITADQDDYNPTGLSTAAILRLSTDATRNINGIAGGADGRIIKIVNVGTQGIVLKDEATTSTAANRFALNSDLTISENQAVEILYDSTTSRWRAIGGTGGSVVLPPSEQNGVVSGGTVTWLQNYDYEVSESFYYIDSVLYHSAATTVTLNAADPTDDRIDLFVLTTSNTATKVTGTASTPPAEPSYDPSTQLKISFAFVENGTTEPVVTQEYLYRENAGTPTEWAYTDNTANLNPASTNNPYAGTLDIEGTSVVAGDSFTLTETASPNFSLYDALVFKIRSKAAWTTRVLSIRWFNGTTVLGTAVLFGDGSFGFNSSNTSSYQNINIPLSNFGLITGADRVTFQRMAGGGSIGFYIDDIQLLDSDLPPAGGTPNLQQVTDVGNTTTNRIGINVSPTSKLHVQTNSIGVSPSDANGLFLENATPAAAGAQQMSPPMVFSGKGWKTDATAASQDVRFKLEVLPVQGASAPTGTYRVQRSINGGAYTDVMTITTDGSTTVATLIGSTRVVSMQFVMNTVSGTAQTYRLVDGGGATTPWIQGANGSTAGNKNFAIHPTDGIILLAGNGNAQIARAAISIENLVNTPADESGDFTIKTMGAGLTMKPKFMVAGKYTSLTEATATAFLRINIPTGEVAGGELIVTIQANDATDFQARTLRLIWAAVNKAGTTTVTISTPEEVVAVSAGTLTATITAVDAGSGNVDFKADATSSLTQTILRANFQVSKNFGTGTIASQ